MWSSQLTNEYSRWEIDGQQIIWTKSIIAQWTMTIISDGSGDARCAEQMFAWCKWDVFVVHIMQTNGTIHWSWSACTCLDQLKWIDYEFRFLNRTNRLTYHWHWHSNCDSGWDRSTVEPARGVSVSVAWRDFQWLYVLLFFSTPLDYFFQGYLPNWTERGRFSSQNQWRIWQGGRRETHLHRWSTGRRRSMFYVHLLYVQLNSCSPRRLWRWRSHCTYHCTSHHYLNQRESIILVATITHA